jgi:hypothetical protein
MFFFPLLLSFGILKSLGGELVALCHVRSEAPMPLHDENCNFRRISDSGQTLIDAGDSAALIDFTRAVLACPGLKTCEFGDYCTILCASLLAEHGRHPHDQPAE